MVVSIMVIDNKPCEPLQTIINNHPVGPPARCWCHLPAKTADVAPRVAVSEFYTLVAADARGGDQRTWFMGGGY